MGSVQRFANCHHDPDIAQLRYGTLKTKALSCATFLVHGDPAGNMAKSVRKLPTVRGIVHLQPP
jgi:hypothetical protein